MLFIINHENMIGFKIKVLPYYAFRVGCYAPARQHSTKSTVRLDSTKEIIIICSLWFGFHTAVHEVLFLLIDNLVQVDC